MCPTSRRMSEPKDTRIARAPGFVGSTVTTVMSPRVEVATVAPRGTATLSRAARKYDARATRSSSLVTGSYGYTSRFYGAPGDRTARGVDQVAMVAA